MLSRISTTLVTVAALCMLVTLFVPQEALCVPSFARGQTMDCTACHTVFPQLNETGREFKEGGYEFGDRTEISDGLSLENNLPVSARLNFRVVDKRTSKTKTSDSTDKDKQLKLRVFHELEAFFAGRAGEQWNYFVEFESEDEFPAPAGDDGGFGIQVHAAVGQWHPDPRFQITGGWGSPFFADPYNTLHHHKPARFDWAPAGILPGNGQFVSVSGRPAPKLFALVAYHANSGSAEGELPKDVSARVAVDAVPNLSVGGFVSSVNTHAFTPAGADSTDDRTNIFGGDVQFAHENNGTQLNVHGIFGAVSEPKELTGSGKDETETFFGIEGNALFPAGKALVGPIATVSRYTTHDGDDSWVNGGFFLNVNFKQNVRGQVGWEGVLSAPDAYTDKESRITVAFDVAF